MPSSPVQEIKERLDIVDFIRSYITLLPAGKNFKANCPFHKERTPSFMVSPERQTWHCFGACSEGGDIFKFLMKYENLEFYEALKILAERAGIELKRASPAEYKQFGILYEINSLAKDFFKRELEKSPEVLKYAHGRGLKKETIEEFELGFAPNGFDKLTLDLINIGFSVKDIERAGLAFKSERGGYIDRFRGRLMFPIYNHFGKVVGFSGRILPQYENDSEKSSIGKYVNSPETPIFNKSRVFYGLHKTKNNIKETGVALLVEGQMDFLMLYQDGIKNAAATSGTALTGDHLKMLRRLTDQLILFFDNDEAGFKAAERSIDLAGANDFNVKLLLLKGYKDPAEAVEKQPGLITNLLKDAKPAMEFYFGRYLPQNSKVQNPNTKLDIGSFKKNLRIILAKIRNLMSPVERSHWLKELSERTNINETALAEETEQLNISSKFQDPRFKKIPNTEPMIRNSRRTLIAERLLSLVMARDSLKLQIKDYIRYLPEDYSFILENLREEKGESAAGKFLIEEKLNPIINIISLRSSFELEILGEDKIEDEFRELLRQIQYEFLKEKRNKLAHSIKEIEKTGDETVLTSALKEFDEVSKMIENSR